MIGAPERLSAEHDLSGFDCGEPSLNDWLRRRARQNEESGASRTYVVPSESRIAGYYSLAVGAIAHAFTPGRIRRNMPDPVPAMVLGRFAVDRHYHGLGIGTGLLRDAVKRTVQASEIAGIRVILVHAISAAAKHFYERYGFVASPIDPMTVMLPVSEATKLLRV